MPVKVLVQLVIDNQTNDGPACVPLSKTWDFRAQLISVQYAHVDENGAFSPPTTPLAAPAITDVYAIWSVGENPKTELTLRRIGS